MASAAVTLEPVAELLRRSAQVSAETGLSAVRARVAALAEERRAASARARFRPAYVERLQEIRRLEAQHAARLERAYARTHLTRLTGNTVQSIETSSLHIDLISDLRRINSHICSIAYPILDSAGALAPSRLRQQSLAE